MGMEKHFSALSCLVTIPTSQLIKRQSINLKHFKTTNRFLFEKNDKPFKQKRVEKGKKKVFEAKPQGFYRGEIPTASSSPPPPCSPVFFPNPLMSVP